MFGSAVMLATGGAMRQFSVFRSAPNKTTAGRVLQGEEALLGEICGITNILSSGELKFL